MKIICPGCQKVFNIPDERLRTLKSNVVMPCPACKESIEINLPKSKEVIKKEMLREAPQSGSSQKKQSDGEALKEKILRKVEDLPPMPQVAQKARKIVADSSSNFTDLAKVIETDQAIAAKVLKMANSAYYGAVGDVSSVQQASVVLGTKTLIELLNIACASGPLAKTLKGYELEAGDLWKHSLAVAAGSRIIAKKKRPELTEDAFSTGLIHDVGKIILDPYIFERKEAFQEVMQNGDKSFLSAEKQILGFDHGEIASDVCKTWQIPSHLSLAIRHHHDPSNLNGNELAHITHVADVVAIMTGIGGGFDGMLYKIDDRALDILNLSHTDVTILMGEVSEYVEKTVERM